MKEKLIALIEETVEIYPSELETLVDRLIANGVTLQRWIPVSERLPAADFSEGEEFNICIANYNWEKGTWTREAKTARWSGDYFYWAGGGEVHAKITHWQVLPDLPKEEE